MITPNHRDPDEEDLDLARRACAGSIRCLSLLLARHRPLLFYIYFNWCGSEQLANEMIESLQFRVTLRLRYRPAHTTVRLWLYRLAIRHLLESEPSPGEHFVRYPACWRHHLHKTCPSEEDDCSLRRYAPFDCRIAVVLSLTRHVRIPYILDALVGIKPVLGARIMDIPLDVYRQRTARSRENVAVSIHTRSTRHFPLCPSCFRESNSTPDPTFEISKPQAINGMLLPTVTDWLAPNAPLAIDACDSWLRRSFITLHPETPAIVQLLQQDCRNGRIGPGQQGLL
jgi:DNA-directed RNA polymerase specialized sigma24 family protein